MTIPATHCPECASPNIEFSENPEKFKYRSGEEQVELNVKVDTGYCNDCKFQWTDMRAEFAMTDAVCRFLQKENQELREKLKAFQESSKY